MNLHNVRRGLQIEEPGLWGATQHITLSAVFRCLLNYSYKIMPI